MSILTVNTLKSITLKPQYNVPHVTFLHLQVTFVVITGIYIFIFLYIYFSEAYPHYIFLYKDQLFKKFTTCFPLCYVSTQKLHHYAADSVVNTHMRTKIRTF